MTRSTYSKPVAAYRCRMAFGSLLGGLLLTACTDVADNLPVAASAPPMHTVYLIQPGDILDVKFVKNPALNEQPTVQPDGRISMLYAPNLGRDGVIKTAFQATNRHPCELDEGS
jgi:protein involved in polysaccharide export with SLBB domain